MDYTTLANEIRNSTPETGAQLLKNAIEAHGADEYQRGYAAAGSIAQKTADIIDEKLNLRGAPSMGDYLRQANYTHSNLPPGYEQ